jgi:hypothetical protein
VIPVHLTNFQEVCIGFDYKVSVNEV